MDVTMPDGTVIQGVPDGTTKAQLTAKYAAHTAQPTTMQTIAASPVGRLAHDAVLRPVEGALSMFPLTSGAGDALSSLTEKPYADAVAAQQNRPGYADARAAADKMIAAKGGSGLTDQLTAPLNATMAGIGGGLFGGSLNASNAAADAQSAGQGVYQQAHPALSTGAQIVGGFLASPQMPKLGAAQQIAKPFLPSIADLKSAAKDAYRTVDNSGISVSNDAMNGMADKLQDTIGNRLDPTLHPDATAAYNRVSQFATDGKLGTNPATFSDLDNLRRVAADATQSIKPADKAMARQIVDHIDDFVDNLKPDDLDTSALDEARSQLMGATSAKGQVAKQMKNIEQNKPGALISRGAAGAVTRQQYMDLADQLQGTEAQRQSAFGNFQNENDLINAGPEGVINSLNSARDLWRRASQAQTIQSQIDKAGIKASANYSQSGMENALRQQFKSLALNDRAMGRLAPEVQQAVKDVAAGSPVGNALRAVGKYAPHGPVATGAGAGLGYMMGGPEAGIGAAVALPTIGEAARVGATALTRARAQRALETAITSGRGAAMRPLPVPPLQLPQLTSRSVAPLGLFGSGFGQQMQPQYQ